MLTTDHLNYRTRGGEIKLEYLDTADPNYQEISANLIRIYFFHICKTRGELDQAILDYESDSTDYRIVRGLAKLLDNLCEFEIESAIEPEILREKIFDYSSKNHPIVTKPDLIHKRTPADLTRAVADELGISSGEVLKGMYADLDENRILKEFDPPTIDWLLDRYNTALAQAMLYRATEMTIRIYRNIPTKYKLVFKFVKFFKLMHVISGNNANGYRITLDGPASMFRLSKKYGIQMALFLPALLHCDRWRMEAKIRISKKQDLAFSLDGTRGLMSHYRDPGEFDSKLERKFSEAFEKIETDWILERETDIIDLKDTVMIPDFNICNPDGREALMEIVGFWTPDYLQKKLWKLKRANKTNMIIVVSDRLNCSADDFHDIPGELIFFKTVIKPKDVIECAERCAI